MKKFLICVLCIIGSHLATQAQLCCNVVDGSGVAVVSSNGICVVAPNLAGDGNCGVMDADEDGVPDDLDGCPEVAGTLATNGCPDTDGDGTADANDKCPNVAGAADSMGCPDSDSDGIIDSEDKCPNVAGSKDMEGCPDTDGDGITDADDECPTVSGLKANAGCPEKDSDNDGVIDKNDKCPEVAGITANSGCPEVKEEVKEVLREALAGVQFKSGSDLLISSSNAKLDKVVSVMKDNPSFKLKISGYTDNTGNEQKNLELSQKRAHAAEKYLVDRGISASRISAEGYGIIKPVADNATREGRAKNRRVEFEIVF